MKTETKKINLVELSTKEMETVQGGYTSTLEERTKKTQFNYTLEEEQNKRDYTSTSY